MAIVERGKKTTTPVKITLPIPEGTREAIENIDELRTLLRNQDIRLKKLGVLEQQIKTLHSILETLNPPIYCPDLKKEIDIHWCHSACKSGLCEPRYSCKARVELLKKFFKINPNSSFE